MWVELLKFMHIVCALTLTGVILFNGVMSFKTTDTTLVKFDVLGLGAAILLYLTGASLVAPKGFTFATPWISAAFMFLAILAIQFGATIYAKSFGFNKLNRLINLNYIIMIVIAIAIIHDAVSKHTLWQ